MLIQELIKNKHEVTLYAHALSRPGCRLIGYTESEKYNLSDLIKINLLTAKIAFQRYDLVHTFGRMSNIALLMMSNLPKIVSYQLPPTVSQVKKAVRIARTHSLHFTACSNYIARKISAHANVTTIYNGVNMDDYQFNDLTAADAPLIFLGRIQKEKGTTIAIDIAKATGRKLIIAGNVPNEAIHQDYFNNEVKPHIDGKQISYIGPVNNIQKNELLRNGLAFLMPVTWDEPFGIVMAEALACGTPVIGFNRGAVPEVVVDGVNGYICANADEMITAVNNISIISRHTCRRIAEEKFSAGILAGQYQQLYQQVTSGNV